MVFGNYNLEVGGVKGTDFENKSVLNLYFLDSGDYSKVPFIPGYGWIKPSQQLWFKRTSQKLRVVFYLFHSLAIFWLLYTFFIRGLWMEVSGYSLDAELIFISFP